MDNSFRYLETVEGDETELEYPYLAEVQILLLIVKLCIFKGWILPLQCL